MGKALAKMALAYLDAQTKYLVSDKKNRKLEQDLADLQHRYKMLKEQKAFLQTDRNKWFDAYNQIVETNELQMVEQANEMRQLKAENERLRAYVIEKDGKQPENDLAVSIDPATGESLVYREHNGVIEVWDVANPSGKILYTLKSKSGYLLSISNAGMPIFGATRQSALYIKFFRVIDYYKFYYNAANNDHCELVEVAIVDLYNPTIWDNDKKTSYILKNDGIKISDEVQPAPTLQELEKVDIVIVVSLGKSWVCGISDDGRLRLCDTTDHAIKFESVDEVHKFLKGEPLGSLQIWYWELKTGYLSTDAPETTAEEIQHETTEKADEPIQPTRNPYGHLA